jgi:FkbM family methyltransferase
MFYVRHLLIKAFVMRRGYNLCRLGDANIGCSWTFCPDGLDSNSIVYSGGVGNDISFEHALAKQFGCVVYLLDPSPTGVKTMSLPENNVPFFRFMPVGLAGSCCTLRLAPPLYADEGSWFATERSAGAIEAQCLDLATLLKQNGHDHVDLLKLDIEGAEYSVLDQILDAKLPVRQILVEFHDGLLPGIRLRQSIRATWRLLARGYKLIAEVGTTRAFILPPRRWRR